MTREEARRLIDAELGNIAPEADLSALPDSADIRLELDIDSIGFLELITALHTRTGVNIPERDAAQLGTRAALMAYLEAHGA
jgi:acyl carrier protein